MKKYYVYNTFSQKCELTDVSDQVYTELKRMDWRQEKHSEVIEDKEIPFSALEKNGCIVYESFREFAELSENVEETIISKEQTGQLGKALMQLTSEEFELIFYLYIKNISEREYGKLKGISQKNINKKKHKVLCKLHKLLENNKFFCEKGVSKPLKLSVYK